jgi:uncharacterized protein YcnI
MGTLRSVFSSATAFFFGSLVATSAQAHVTLDPKQAPAGDYAKLVFLVPHGCDGAPTTEIIVTIPKGVVAVKPQVHAGWRITTKTAKYDKPVSLHGKEIVSGVSEVSWRGGPLDDAYMDEFGMSVKLPDLPGETLVFPVVQVCKTGKSEWVEATATRHADSGAHLQAPVLLLGPTSASKHVHSGDAAAPQK